MNALIAALLLGLRPPPMVESKAAACTSLVPAAIGGPMPPESIATLRWFGTTNFELAHRGQVILLDTFYDRGPRFHARSFRSLAIRQQMVLARFHTRAVREHAGGPHEIAKVYRSSRSG